MKLTVEYDPMVGHVCRDGEAQGWVDDVIHTSLYKMEHEINPIVIVASSLLIDLFRLRLAQGVITKDQIAFKFQGEMLEHNEYAQMKHWPKGFCDQDIHIMSSILKIQSNGWKKRKSNE